MIKKVFILLMIFGMLLGNRVYAEENTETKVDLTQIESFSEKLQQDTDYLPNLSVSKMINTYKSTGSVGFTAKNFMDSLVKFIFKEIVSNSRLMMELLFIGLLCAVLQNIQGAFSEDGVSKIAYYACFLLMVIIIIKSFTMAINVGRDTINQMIEFTNAMMPPLLGLLAAVGGFASAATLDPIVLFVIKVTSDIIRDFVLPLTVVTMTLNIVNNLSDGVKITKLAGLVKQISLWSLGFIMTVFIGVVTIRSSTAATLDQVALKTTKYAMDNFIPIIGKTLSDAIATVAGYSLVLKDALSIAGLIIMVLICIFPLIKIILLSLIYKFVGAVMEPIVDKRVVDCLTSAGSSLTIIFSSVLAVGIMFFIMITIIVSTGKLVMMVR